MANSYPGFYTRSHYIQSLSYLPGYGSELAANSQSNLTNNSEIVILDFGKPTVQTQRVKKNKIKTYGASLFGSTFTSTDDIANGVEQFIDSFVASFQSSIPYSVMIAVGTSNYGSQVTQEHGAAWGNMINSINTYVLNKAGTDSRYNSVHVVGANDMETDWNSPSVTRAWVNGYRNATNYQLCNYGDAGGMPQAHKGDSMYISGTGNNGWTLDDIWYVSDGGMNPNTNDFYSFALPEIYTTSGTQAAQWFNLNLYAHQKIGNNNRPLNIYGVLTEYDADNTTNPPSGSNSGWNQLEDYMINSSTTVNDLASGTPFMQWATDISWKLPNQP